MKIIAILGEGSNQRALACRMNEAVPLAHIAKVASFRRGKRQLGRALISFTIARSLRKTWRRLLKYYDIHFPDWPPIPSSDYPSANDDRLCSLIERERPALVLVSGTDLLTEQTLDRFDTKVMNLHTGISPYLKGSPDCTNWALSLGEFDLIGSTVMWIDPGIDSGAIIATERAPLTGNEGLTELHIRVMDHAHDLYRRAVSAWAAGKSLKSIPQENIDPGRLFRNRQWNGRAMARAAFNFRFRYRPFACRKDIKLVRLSET